MNKRLAELSLYEFAKQAWHVVEPETRFVDGWHVKAICDHLEAVTRGEIPKLLINVPPGCMKSLLTSVFWPAWVWIGKPESRFLFASYDQKPVLRDSIKCRQLTQSQWYRENWGDRWEFTGDQNQKGWFETDKGGWRMAIVVGTGTGLHPDYVVVDDPHNVRQAESEAERTACLNWWSGTMSTRGESRGVRRAIIMQRLHEEDLSGHVLKAGGWEHICLPMRYEPGRMKPTSLGWTDPRTEPGALLWPELFDEKKVEALEHAISMMGEGRVAGQLQQRPPAHYEGAEWPADYFRDELIYFDEWPDLSRFVLRVCFCDPSLGQDQKGGDYSAIVSIGLDEHGTMWVGCNMERRDYYKIVDDSLEIHEWFKPNGFGFENVAFQVLLSGLVAERSKSLGMMIPVWEMPTGGIKKDVRIRRLTPYLKRGEFKFFRDKGGELLVRQLKAFPGGQHDDGPDALEGGVRLLRHLFSTEANQGETMQVAVA